MNEVGKQKYEITQCQSQEITLSKRIGIFLHLFYFNDNRCVVYFENWKVAIELLFRVSWVEVIAWKKNKMTKLLLLHLVSFKNPSILRMLLFCFKLGISDLKDVRSNFLTLVVQSTISFILFLLHKLLQRGLALISLGKCGSPLIKVTLTELSISNLRHAFTLN